ncbi:hypothetical protein ES703_51747 [subsurface metagenome]
MSSEKDKLAFRKLQEERKNCPFNHTRLCPHQLFQKDPIWCQCCILIEILKAVSGA